MSEVLELISISDSDMECDQCDAYDGESPSNIQFNENKKCALLSLNYDCLLLVLRHLNLIDLINVSSTCKTLRDVSESQFSKFDTFDFSNYKSYLKKTTRSMPIEKILSKMKPYIVSLKLNDFWNRNGFDNDETLCRAIMMYCTQLKTLSGTNSNILKWINVSKLESLSLGTVNRNDFNNFTHGLTKLKNLHLRDVDKKMSSEEFNYFLLKNPNIESLKFMAATPAHINFNIFKELTNLKRLCLVLEKRISNLQPLLHIRELTELTLEFRIVHDFSFAITLFEGLAKRGTLKKLEIRGMRLCYDTYRSLSLLNLDSIRIVLAPLFHSYDELCNALPNLKHLDILQRIDYVSIIFLIQNLRKLESLTLVCLEKWDNESFLRTLREILEKPVDRPVLTIFNFMDIKALKIDFNLCHFEFVTKTYKTDNDLEIYSGNPFIYSSRMETQRDIQQQ